MASSWLFRPLPLWERVGRGVALVSRTLRTRQLVMPSPPHPNPLPRGEREPEVPSDKGVISNSTVLGLDPDVLSALLDLEGLQRQPWRLSGMVQLQHLRR